jgi:hypothetical protein
VVDIFDGDETEGRGGSGRCNLVELALGGGVGASGDESARGIASLTRLGERDRRERPERQHVLAPAEAISEAPELASGWLHEGVQATSVR